MNGNRIWIDATIAVDPELNVVKSHEITEIVEQKFATNTKVHSL